MSGGKRAGWELLLSKSSARGKETENWCQYSELLLTSNNMKLEQVLAELLGCLSGALWGQGSTDIQKIPSCQTQVLCLF